MGLLERIVRQGAERPTPVRTSWEPGLVCAPVAGEVVALADVSDPTFASGMLGQGLGLRPEAGVVVSPVSGKVAAFLHAGHAVAVEAEDGAQVLVHVGCDTVRLHGKAFEPFARVGWKVAAGEALLAFDRAAIRAAGLDDTVIVCVMNPLALGGTTPLVEAGSEVVAGQPVLRCGQA